MEIEINIEAFHQKCLFFCHVLSDFIRLLLLLDIQITKMITAPMDSSNKNVKKSVFSEQTSKFYYYQKIIVIKIKN